MDVVGGSGGVEEGRSDVDAALTATGGDCAVGVAELGRVVVGAGVMGTVGRRSMGTVGISGRCARLERREGSVSEVGG